MEIGAHTNVSRLIEKCGKAQSEEIFKIRIYLLIFLLPLCIYITSIMCYMYEAALSQKIVWTTGHNYTHPRIEPESGPI